MEYTLENYNKELKEIEVEMQARKKRTLIKYADANNTLKIGDKVKDHIGEIIIEKILYSIEYRTGMPKCVYYGFELKKDGEIRKDKSKREVYQQNVC